MKYTTSLMILAALAAAPACSSTRYGDAKAVETVNIDWGSTDLQTIAAKMTKSLSESPALQYMANPAKGQDQRVAAYMGGVRNETSEHVNTEAVTDAIRTDLMHGGKIRFVVDSHGQSEIGDQVKFQQESGRVDPSLAKKFGKQLGAEVVIYGALRSIDKTKGRSIESGLTRVDDRYYQFVLNAVNVETGELIWSEMSEIRKTARTGILGSR
jgi:uncharacterized protein (TIGR02722 family)